MPKKTMFEAVMSCPHCGARKSGVIDKRLDDISDVIRRRRQCKKCRKVFPTIESAP